MLINVSAKVYNQKFLSSPHPYISEPFIELVKGKVDRVVRLVEDHEKVSIGLVGGIKGQTLISPFSSPFGGFHFKHDNILISEIESFISQLISYALSQNLTMIKICIPPAIYHHSFNTKVINTLLRNGFTINVAEISNWVDLRKFTGEFSCKNTRRNYKQSIQNNLSFHEVSEMEEMETVYDLICQNRKWFGRPSNMAFNDFIEVSKLWPVDFFEVRDSEAETVAGAIFYRGHPQIVQGIMWGDNEHGRVLRAMDFCSCNLWNHYKKMGFDFIDLGISTECGIPNNGLIRFKEDCDCISGLRLCFSLNLIGVDDQVQGTNNDFLSK
jgi:hypothetical protein